MLSRSAVNLSAVFRVTPPDQRYDTALCFDLCISRDVDLLMTQTSRRVFPKSTTQTSPILPTNYNTQHCSFTSNHNIMPSRTVMFTSLTCASSPERVAVEEEFEVKLKTTLQPKSGETFQCRCPRIFRPDNGYALPLVGKTPVAYEEGYFTFKLTFLRKDLNVKGNPIKLPVSYKILFDHVGIKEVGDTVLAFREVPIIVK
ncbi:hypothetical protein CC79DRAFT_1325253 [Sarocladium strictum]